MCQYPQPGIYTKESTIQVRNNDCFMQCFTFLLKGKKYSIAVNTAYYIISGIAKGGRPPPPPQIATKTIL
jgi:hypothetical protein